MPREDPPSSLDSYEAVEAYFSMAVLNHVVRLVGWVMPVPTTTAQAPASMAARASAGVWT